MAYVTATNGEQFFVWPLPADSARQVSPGISFNRIRNDLGNGYRAQVLHGSDTGLRRWQISQNTLGGTGFPVPEVDGIYGEDVTQEQALWDLYCECQVTGKPFVYRCPRDSQYYLVEFEDQSFQYEKQFRVAQYAGQITLTQVREDGVSVFVVPEVAGNWFYQSTHNFPSSGDWGNAYVLGQYLTATGGVTFAANPQNGFNTVRLNGSSGYLTQSLPSSTDVIVAMKVNSSTFSNNGGLFCGASNIIRGTSGGTKWQDPSITGLEYSLNGVDYPTTNMQAPMNEWGICHFKATSSGMNITTFGRDAAGTAYLGCDIGELIVADGALTRSVARQIIEHLSIKWR